MIEMTNRQWRLAAHPSGMLKESDLVLHETPVPEPTEGEYLVRMRFLIVHPEARLALSRAEVGE